jgi:peptidoglycan/xylan/chitin deacetylase (PgdA/CDA1 family)
LVKKERLIIKHLLSLFRKYKLPATWAVVGKMFLEGDPLWQGPDIVKMIKTTPNQEIACHSFTHQIFSEAICDKKTAEKEIKNCLKVAETVGIKFKSFVFPKNIPGHFNILKKYGFSNFRGAEPYWFAKIPYLRKPLQVLDFILALPPPVSKPIKTPYGLTNIPGSMYYVSCRGSRRFIPIKIRVLKAKKGLTRAAKEKKIFHLWFHPIDFAKNTKKMFAGFEEILKYAVKLRNENKIEIKSMKQIAEEFSGEI